MRSLLYSRLPLTKYNPDNCAVSTQMFMAGSSEGPGSREVCLYPSSAD